MDNKKQHDFIKTLFRQTVEGDLEWKMDVMSKKYDGAVKTMIADRIVVVYSDGKMEVTSPGGYKFSWETAFTKDLYKAARSSAWDGPEPEAVIESFLEDVK